MRTARRKPTTPTARCGPTGRRCAIYTRKSSEEGLEQEFNSLDAQREACEAYVRSQRHEGWSLLPGAYDDGGFSGGTLERPALRRLLADIQVGKVDLVIVYKVDRLTRSLNDFARIVEVLDTHGASFVSVTQQFNTTTSMGRLTLNMLLSFAQFEREVTGERIRDKIAASKKKGMWMGGTVPLGYDVRDRKLVVNAAEAETVGHIFRTYLALGSVRLLADQLAIGGVTSKRRRGNESSFDKEGGRLARGALYLMLQNRIYRGEIVHKGAVYPGEHAAIIDQPLWDAVQQQLAHNRIERETGRTSRAPSLLAGLLYDEAGERLIPTHAVKNGKRYRYYVSKSLITNSRAATSGGRRMPAGDIEQLVGERVRQFLASAPELFEALRPLVPEAVQQRRVLDRAAHLARDWPELASVQRRVVLHTLLARIEVHPERVDLHLLPDSLLHLLRAEEPPIGHPSAGSPQRQMLPLILSVPATLRRAGLETKLLVDSPDKSPDPDPSLLRLILKAQAFREILLQGNGASLTDLAEREGVSGSYFTRLVRLAFLAPEIIAAMLDGRQPVGLTANRLLEDTRLPLAWHAQRTLLGFT